jgi:hypothetical protein
MSSKIKKECVHSPARTRPPRKVPRSGKQQVQGKESHSDTSQVSRSLSSDDLDCIVQVTGIPEGLCSRVRRSVDRAVRSVERRNWDRADRQQRRAAAKEIARLTRDLRDKIYEAKDLVGEYVWLTVEWAPDDYEGDDSTISLYDFLLILNDVGEGYERLTSIPVKQVANRPPGTVQNPALRFLIDRLYECIVEEGQGELTLWENVDRELKGTLPMVLKILHDRLPDKVPANLSYTTLRRCISSAKRKWGASRPSI